MPRSQSALLALLDALNASEGVDKIGSAVQVVFQELVEAEAPAPIGAECRERTKAPMVQRNGHRPQTLSTTAGDLELANPKLLAGSLFASLMERHRRIDLALFSVVMEAYVTGSSVHKVDDRVRVLGADTGISKSEVSVICADLDAEVAAFVERNRYETACPYVFLNATNCKARIRPEQGRQRLMRGLPSRCRGNRCPSGRPAVNSSTSRSVKATMVRSGPRPYGR